MSIKVMLADDHVLMREGIRQLLEFDGTISVIAEANNGVECICFTIYATFFLFWISFFLNLYRFSLFSFCMLCTCICIFI